MKILKTIVNVFKTIGVWLSIPFNRRVSIIGAQKLFIALDKIADLTETKTDDKLVEISKQMVLGLLKEIPTADAANIVDAINADKRTFDIKLNEEGELEAGIEIKF